MADRSTIVYDNVRMPHSVVCMPYSVIGKPVLGTRILARPPRHRPETEIGPDTEIDCFAVIWIGVQIGKRCLIGTSATVRENVTTGDDCTIGIGVDLGAGTILGNNVHLQNRCIIAPGTHIGDGCFFGYSVITAADNDVAACLAYKHNPSTQTPPVIGKNVFIGSGARIGPGVTIGDGAVVGIGATVVDDVPPGARIMGEKATLRSGDGAYLDRETGMWVSNETDTATPEPAPKRAKKAA